MRIELKQYQNLFSIPTTKSFEFGIDAISDLLADSIVLAFLNIFVLLGKDMDREMLLSVGYNVNRMGGEDVLTV
ncbi:MAG: hypothetical protein D6732_23250 [Methanobacteriota archaeon]|nr:MAG: hypothetical protein D6732_23250 [Euryarchaeota archaeon]